MKLIVLGSGGFMPQPGVHMPAFLIVHEGRSYLFDCGEWTQVQMVRSNVSAASLRAIAISHLHGDHVLGLPGVLIRKSHQSPEDSELTLLGPGRLEEYVRTNQSILDYDLQFERHLQTLEDRKSYRIGPFELTSRRLDHRAETYGFSFVLTDKKRKFYPDRAKKLGVPEGPLRSKLQAGEAVTLESGEKVKPDQVSDPPEPGPSFVYLTDTRPVYEFPEPFHEPDLLVHEGMFTAKHQQHAREKKHSTAREAARVASHLDAKRLLLTHFSQRYEDHDDLLEEAREVFDPTELAVDGESYELGLSND